MNTYCNGIFAGRPCSPVQSVVLKDCDIPLLWSPFISQLHVAFDCYLVPPTSPDAGLPGGYYIDYSQSPVHLELTGAYCTGTSTNGTHTLAIVSGCPSPP
jgi:hypothetical protein